MITANKKLFKIKTKLEKQNEINDILKMLENGVREVFDSEEYKRYLEFCGKFHNYSFNNIMLILMQYPQAQKCASYATWKSLKMQVKKGEKGIKILCPVPYTYVKKQDDSSNNLTENSMIQISGVKFKIGHVFDISQVEGNIPTLADELTDNPPYILGAVIFEHPVIEQFFIFNLLILEQKGKATIFLYI
jgi:hypothetical protein